MLRSKLDESKEYRYNALRLFVKYDTNGDGCICESELRQCLASEPLFQTGLPKDFSQQVMSVFLKDKTIGPQQFLSLVRGKAASAEETARMLEDARSAYVVAAYDECKQLTSEYAKTFFLATLAMEPQQARATWAIYAWCRRVDEIVDGPDVNPDAGVQRRALEEWNERLERMCRGDPDLSRLDKFDIAFRDMMQQFPGSDGINRSLVGGMLSCYDSEPCYQRGITASHVIIVSPYIAMLSYHRIILCHIMLCAHRISSSSLGINSLLMMACDMMAVI